MIRSTISKMVRSMITTIINPFDGLLSRYFVTLDPVLNSHYEIAQPITFSGDFEIEVEFSTTDTTNQILLGDTHSTSMYFNISANIDVWVSNVRYRFSYGSQTPHDGKLHKVKYKLTSTSLEVFLDGTSLGLIIITPYTGANNFIIGNSNSVNFYFDGIIANAKFTDQSGASDVVTTFKLDQATANIEYSQENVFGSDIWTNPANNINLPWVYSGPNIYSIDGSQTITTLIQLSSATELGSTYQVNFKIENYANGVLQPAVGSDGASFGQQVSANGSYSQVITKALVGGNTSVQFRANSDFSGTLIVESIKKITNAVEYKNIPQSARELYSLDVDTWTGSDVIVNGDFATDSDWTKGSTWTIGNGIASATNSDGSYLYQANICEVGKLYKFKFDVVVSSGISTCVSLFDAFYDYPTALPVGTYEVVHTAVNTTGIRFRCKSGGTGVFAVDNVSVKEVLEVPS